jgi:hypothetical protein
MDNFFYSSKEKEAISVSNIIHNVQNLKYINNNRYISVRKGDTKTLSDKFSIKKSDIIYYNYSIFTTSNSYTIYSEPKIFYLKSRDISPKVYIYHKKLNKPATAIWK